jgi:Immunity protein Imm6
MCITKNSDVKEDEKLIFFLGLSEIVLPEFSQKEDRILAQKVLFKCWEWLKEKGNIGDILYELLDDEENGITIIQEMSANQKDDLAWNCVIDTVAYTSKKAYEREGVNYYPEPIALVDDTLVEHFTDCFATCIKDSNRYIQRMNLFLNDYKNGKIESDLRTEVLKKLQIQS